MAVTSLPFSGPEAHESQSGGMSFPHRLALLVSCCSSTGSLSSDMPVLPGATLISGDLGASVRRSSLCMLMECYRALSRDTRGWIVSCHVDDRTG